VTSLLILVCSSFLNDDVTAHFFLLKIQLLFFSLVIVKGVSLRHSLLGQLLVLVVNTSLNLLNIPLRILFCFGLEMFQLRLELYFFLTLHPSLFNFNSIPFFLNGLFKTGTILLPGHQLKFILQLLFTDVFHFFQVIIELSPLGDRDVNLFRSSCLQFFNLSIVMLNCILLCLIVASVQCLNLAL